MKAQLRTSLPADLVLEMLSIAPPTWTASVQPIPELWRQTRMVHSLMPRYVLFATLQPIKDPAQDPSTHAVDAPTREKST